MKIVLDNTKEIEVGSFTETMDEFGKNLHAINLVSVNDQTQFPTVPQLDELGFTTIKVIMIIKLKYLYSINIQRQIILISAMMMKVRIML